MTKDHEMCHCSQGLCLFGNFKLTVMTVFKVTCNVSSWTLSCTSLTRFYYHQSVPAVSAVKSATLYQCECKLFCCADNFGILLRNLLVVTNS